MGRESNREEEGKSGARVVERTREVRSSVLEYGEIVPEDGVGGDPNLLRLGGGESGQEGLQLVGQEWGRRRALGSLPGTQVLEDAEDDARVLDEGQSPHWMRASRTDQRLDFVDSLVDVNVRFSGRKRSFIRRFQRQNLNVGS